MRGEECITILHNNSTRTCMNNKRLLYTYYKREKIANNGHRVVYKESSRTVHDVWYTKEKALSGI